MTTENKYWEYTQEEIYHLGYRLRRIRALIDLPDRRVKKEKPEGGFLTRRRFLARRGFMARRGFLARRGFMARRGFLARRGSRGKRTLSP